uniref:Uncharacterized protein n=1 Tax=Oscillatoriales cyanobacterium SpSt-402 TaxID=2282168 RepID=A0A832M2I8_9CYAN
MNWILKPDCDIGAGFDWGTSLGKFLISANSYIDHEKLVELLRDHLGTVLPQDEIEDAARSFQAQLRDRVVEKYQSPKSA